MSVESSSCRKCRRLNLRIRRSEFGDSYSERREATIVHNYYNSSLFITIHHYSSLFITLLVMALSVRKFKLGAEDGLLGPLFRSKRQKTPEKSKIACQDSPPGTLAGSRSH